MAEFFTNPVNPRGDDPFVTKYKGTYYYCYATHGGVNVTSAKNIHEIHRTRGESVYTAPEDAYFSKEFWAPELHRLNGRWYIYVAADDGLNDHHRMIVLGALTDDPCGKYEFLGKLAVDEPYDKWAIDGTVMHLKDKTYFIWSGWSGDINVQQNLYIAEMESPTKLRGKRSLISAPELPWEVLSCGGDLPTINEGPIVLQRNGKTFLVYSASGSWSDDYCLGMLTLTGEDPMDPRSWTKCENPVFMQDTECYGPGHNSFTTSPDGSEDYIIYHANTQSKKSWGGRTLRVQKFTWENGVPVFGKPAKVGEPLPVPSTDHPVKDTILFDLDGTLLPIMQDAFVKNYLTRIAGFVCPHGFDPKALVKSLWRGTDAMIANNGSESNHDTFWKIFREDLGDKIMEQYDSLLTFYTTEFDKVREVMTEDRSCRALIDTLKGKGYRLVLATNPVFPAEAVKTRLSWIGLTPEDFELVTSYENADCCKPNVLYFERILEQVGAVAERTMMVGNSVKEDLCAGELGIETWLITDHLENPENLPIGADHQGSYKDFEAFAKAMPHADV